LGEYLQGIDSPPQGPLSISMIRDLYKGDYMAKNSCPYSYSIFYFGTIVAPALGKFFLDHYGWGAIFLYAISSYPNGRNFWFGEGNRKHF